MESPNDAVLKIRGSVIKDPRDWTREAAYGAEAYRAALARLTPDEQKMIDGTLLPSSWYPIATWDRFMGFMRQEAKTRKGHSETEFDMRNMREAGSVVLRTIYKFMLGMMNPRTVVEKAMTIYQRAYSEGRFELLENGPGRARLVFADGSPGFRQNLRHMLPTGLVFVLELCRAKNPRAEISRDETVDGKLVFEVTVTYDV